MFVRPRADNGHRGEPTSYALQIPRGENRKYRRGNVRRRSAGRIAAMLLGLTLSAAAGAFVLSSHELDIQRLTSRVAKSAESGAIALGFGIDQVNVSGHRHAPVSDVFDALDLAHVRGFWQLDSDAALKRIERISWVDRAQITRVFPGRLDVEIRERKAAALWTRGDAQYLVDATGRVLGSASNAHDWVLPRISGEGANAKAEALLGAFGRHPEFAKNVAVSERIANRRWRIALNNGSRIELAAEREVEGLNQVVDATAIRQALAGVPVAVDLRTRGRVSVHPLDRPSASEKGAQP